MGGVGGGGGGGGRGEKRRSKREDRVGREEVDGDGRSRKWEDGERGERKMVKGGS